MKFTANKRPLTAILIMLIALFAVSLFKNIAYPLLWNDEAETAMFAERILEYGYPKVYDGKNVVYHLSPDIELGVKKESDAYIGTVWGHFYFSTIGAFLARRVDDIYAKTALLRMPFALAGLAGLVIMALAAARPFEDDPIARLLFFIAYSFFVLLSISLVLHLREARYYSMAVLLLSSALFLYTGYKFFDKIRPGIYIAGMALTLFAVFNTFTPAYFILVATIGLYEFYTLLRWGRRSAFLLSLSPLAISAILAVPPPHILRDLPHSGLFLEDIQYRYTYILGPPPLYWEVLL